MTESHWLAARMNFRTLRERHPGWTVRAYGEALGQSRTWVKWSSTLCTAYQPLVEYCYGETHSFSPHDRSTAAALV